jgi:DnaK suppressor protein
MDKAQREEFKRLITKEIESLRQSIPALEESTEPVAPDAAIGTLSRLDTMLNQGISKSALAAARHRIRKLEAALAQVDDPEFGLCAECGGPIGLARMRALPETHLCVRCAE